MDNLVRYALQVTMKQGNYTDAGLTERELQVRIAAYLKDSNSLVLHVTKYEV